MYDELVKRLRAVAGGGREEKCDGCPYEEDYPCCVDCLEKLHNQAADAIEYLAYQNAKWEKAVKTVLDFIPRWIPVTERLPEDCTPVQVCYIGYYSKKISSDMLACRYKGLWCYWDGELCSYDPCLVEITHWQPLPEPPKEG